MKLSVHEEWTKDYKKIKGIFYDIKLIYEQFKHDTTKDEYDNDSIGISYVSSSDINFK